MSKKIGRLAMRREGAMWNAYYAMPGTMEGALLLGSICMTAVPPRSERKQVFMEMMRDVVADLIEQQTGQRPTFPEGFTTAPESERAGHA